MKRSELRRRRERVTGIEPALSAWEAEVLPLNYTRATPSRALRRRSYPLEGVVLQPGPAPGALVPVRPGWQGRRVTATLRPFHPSDLPGMYRVCLLTGAAGQDATSLYRDPDLLAHVYCGPYPVADPGLSFVVVDSQGVGGYVVATADTAGFDAWCERAWWPVLRAQHPAVPDPRDGTEDHVLLDRIHHPDPSPAPPGAPAHLHIDLLPRLQGQGWGRRLIGTLAGALRERGVPGVHLGVAAANTRAIAFYEHLGFRLDSSYHWGRRLVLDLREPHRGA